MGGIYLPEFLPINIPSLSSPVRPNLGGGETPARYKYFIWLENAMYITSLETRKKGGREKSIIQFGLIEILPSLPKKGGEDLIIIPGKLQSIVETSLIFPKNQSSFIFDEDVELPWTCWGERKKAGKNLKSPCKNVRGRIRDERNRRNPANEFRSVFIKPTFSSGNIPQTEMDL